MSINLHEPSTIVVHEPGQLDRNLKRWETFIETRSGALLSRHPAWLGVLGRGLGQTPYCIEAIDGGETRGLLPLAHVRSLLFGGFLVGLPYLNYGGVIADDETTAHLLIDHAIELADRLNVRYLELRHERAIDHPALVARPAAKVHMRRSLPTSADALWKDLASSVRNQIRKGRNSGLTVAWGGADLLVEFYDVFSRNMRDLGTPVFGRALFRETIRAFPDRSEFCVVRLGPKPVAAALLLHGQGITEVPSASSLRRYNPTCANMLMYWHLLDRAVDRGQAAFDFGRSSPGGSHFKFKEQWGARPHPADWQFHIRRGAPGDMRPDNPRFRYFVRAWRTLPLSVTRWLGPPIVRGIP